MTYDFLTYLRKHYRTSTVTRYTKELNNYLLHTKNAETASYTDVLNYIGHLRKHHHKTGKIQAALQAIKQYYYYLLHIKKRDDHPCRYVVLKDKKNKSVQLQDLFTTQELESLLHRKERYKLTEIRNKVIISLLIYQGITLSEFVQLKINDINLEQGTIKIKGGAYTNSRTIGLHSSQIMLLHQYINDIHPKLLQRSKLSPLRGEPERGLILTWVGTPENGEGINYLISTYKKQFPGRNINPKTIRQSVITNLLKQGKDVRIVQAYVGHKSPDTTEKYKQGNTEELQQMINKYHPL
jgi:integrase/recombinase XerD